MRVRPVPTGAYRTAQGKVSYLTVHSFTGEQIQSLGPREKLRFDYNFLNLEIISSNINSEYMVIIMHLKVYEYFLYLASNVSVSLNFLSYDVFPRSVTFEG